MEGKQLKYGITLLMAAFVCSFGQVLSQNELLYETETRLKIDLLKNYDKTVPPIASSTGNVTVSVGMGLNNIESLDEVKGILTTDIWLRAWWVDMRLTWNASNYNGLGHVAIPYDLIWRPDLVPYNIATDKFQYSADYQAVVSNDGSVYFIPHIRLHTRCNVMLTNYPFDTHTCLIKFGSWVYNGNQVALKKMASGLDLLAYAVNSQFDLVKTNQSVRETYYPCCEEPYFDYTVYLIMARRTSMLMHMYIGPAVCFSLMIPFVFLLPARSNSKLILGGMLMISQTLVLTMMADSLPTSHFNAPRITLYFLGNIVLLALSMICSSVIITCLDKARKGGPGVPSVIDSIFIGILGRIFCVKRHDFFEDSDSGMNTMENVSNTDNSAGQIGDSDAMVKEYARLVAPAEWRQLTVVLDRLFFVLFLLVTIITMASMVHYK